MINRNEKPIIDQMLNRVQQLSPAREALKLRLKTALDQLKFLQSLASKGNKTVDSISVLNLDNCGLDDLSKEDATILKEVVDYLSPKKITTQSLHSPLMLFSMGDILISHETTHLVLKHKGLNDVPNEIWEKFCASIKSSNVRFITIDEDTLSDYQIAELNKILSRNKVTTLLDSAAGCIHKAFPDTGDRDTIIADLPDHLKKKINDFKGPGFVVIENQKKIPNQVTLFANNKKQKLDHDGPQTRMGKDEEDDPKNNFGMLT